MSRFSDALITRVVVQGFRSLEHVAVDLGPVTVLVGPNSSGKSSFVNALIFLQQVLYGSPSAVFQDYGGFDEVLTRTGRKPDAISIEVQVQSRTSGEFSGDYFVKFEMRKRPKRLVVTEACEMRTGLEQTMHRFRVEDGRWKVSPEGIEPQLAEGRLALPLMTSLEYFAPMYNALISMCLYHIELGTLKAWQKPGRGTRMSMDGSNAASVLQRLREADVETYQRIVQSVSLIVSSIQDVGITTRERGRELTFTFSESFVGHQAISFQASSMSDGTLHALSLLLAAYQEDPPTLIAFEEPGMAVHPGAAAVLAEALKEAGLRTQVLITTHSPDLVTRFDVDMLQAVERTSDGVTVIAPIAESQREAIRRRLFTAGELHRIEGLRPESSTSEE
jgi:predicted ATPase